MLRLEDRLQSGNCECRNMTGKNSKGPSRGGVGGAEIRGVPGTPGRQGPLGSKRTWPQANNSFMSLTAGCRIPFLEVILKLLFLQILSFCVSTLPLRAPGRWPGMQEMRACWV